MAVYRRVSVKDAGGEEIHQQMIVNGHRVNTFGKTPKVTADIIHNLVNLPIRDDDVMFCSAVKSGTHWGFEVISMLLNGKAETVPLSKIEVMLENTLPEDLEKLPSPRVLNSHLPLSVLPKQLKEKKTKVVLMLRNPKDVAVSFYHHHKGVTRMNYNGKFENHYPLFLTGQLEYGDWFDYVIGMEKAMEDGEYDILLIYFEDMKKNGLEEIRRIAKFLGLQESEELFEAIHDKCHFRKMAIEKEYHPELAKSILKPGFSMFRKGEIGDWKNHFTVAINEEFDAMFNERMKDSKLHFQFT